MGTMLLLTLPTPPNAVRLRAWRALQALGCGALRDRACPPPAAVCDALLAAPLGQAGTP